jgi:hypothetical protein
MTSSRNNQFQRRFATKVGTFARTIRFDPALVVRRHETGPRPTPLTNSAFSIRPISSKNVALSPGLPPTGLVGDWGNVFPGK